MGWGFRTAGLIAALLLAAGCQPNPVSIDLAVIAADAREIMGYGPMPSSILWQTDGALTQEIRSKDEGVYILISDKSGAVVDRLFVPRDPARFSSSRPEGMRYEPLEHGVYRYDFEG